MSVQQTSIDAYREIQPSLGERQQEVLGVFYEMPSKPDWTNKEIAVHLNRDVAYISPRVFELREMGLLEHSRFRMCGITQRRVNAWRLATAIRSM